MTTDNSASLDPTSGDVPEDPRLVEVVDAYLKALEAGARPDRRAFIQRYPEIADAVAACIDGLELVHAGIGSRPGSRAPQEALDGLGQGGLASPLGDFQILRELARGGMGVVYEAIQLSLGRRVALKVLPFAATFDSRQLQRFKNEAQAAALLHHTHIVPIYAVGCERGVHFYAMQLIEGQSLATVIGQLRQRESRSSAQPMESTLDRAERLESLRGQASAPLAQRSTIHVTDTITGGSSIRSETYVRRAARLIVQAAEALEHAHQEGVVHRDIKPANLLIDASGSLWVTDFGLAQLQADNGLTRSGDVLGTFRYMSPEQTSGQRTVLDHRTDIYSLGATFYELLTLEPVFSGENHQQLLYQILNQDPRNPSELNKAVPPELDTIILKALSKLPGDRYRSALEFSADVQRYLDHQPILAQRPSLLDRARKWSRRHPGAAIATMSAMALIAVLSLASQYRISLEQQRTKDALAREEQRAVEAEQRFQQARQAVDAMFQISEEELADKPSEGARRRILEIVLNYYQDFIDQRRGDPEAQAELAAVQEKVKAILHELTVMQRMMHARLLASESVRDELQLSDQQEAQLKPLLEQWLKQQDTLLGDRSQSEDERRLRLVRSAETYEKALVDVITPQQNERFRQIALQALGIFAFREPDIVKVLRLTNEQRSQLRAIEREVFIGSFLGKHPPGEPSGLRTHRAPPDRARDADVMNQAMAVLSPTQLATWRALTGEPFTALSTEEFSFPRLGIPR